MVRHQEFGKARRPPRQHTHVTQIVVESEWTKWVRTIKIVGAMNGAALIAGRVKGYW